jgi:NADPH2:quinone reductase
VIAVASSKEKLDIAREHGADLGINYTEQDLKQALKDVAPGKGIDILYDCVGGPHAEPALRAMAWAGRYLVIGFAAGDIPRLPLNVIMLKGCSVVGVILTGFAEKDPKQSRANIAQLLDWAKEGRISPLIHATFPLAETADALALIQNRKATGKVIVNPQL